LAKLFAVKFHKEINVEFKDTYPNDFLVNSKQILVPIPSAEKIIQLNKELEVANNEFFTGDQMVALPFCFGEPLCVVTTPIGGFYVCDALNNNILFFNDNGSFLYAKSPPGILEHSFNHPLNIATDSSCIAVLDIDMRLHIINAHGIKKTINLNPFLEPEQLGACALSWYKKKIYLLPHGMKLIIYDPELDIIDFLTLPEEKIVGKPQTFCVDSDGNFYFLTAGPASLVVLSEDLIDILAVYDRYGYQSGELRFPKNIKTDENGYIYIVDDNRIIKMHIAIKEEIPIALETDNAS